MHMSKQNLADQEMHGGFVHYKQFGNGLKLKTQKTIITPTTTAGALCKAKSLRIPSLHETSCVSFRVAYLRTLTLSLYLCYFF